MANGGGARQAKTAFQKIQASASAITKKAGQSVKSFLTRVGSEFEKRGVVTPTKLTEEEIREAERKAFEAKRFVTPETAIKETIMEQPIDPEFAPKVKFGKALDVKKIEAEQKRQEQIVEEQVLKQAKLAIRKESVKTATAEAQKFEKSLSTAFDPIVKKAEEFLKRGFGGGKTLAVKVFKNGKEVSQRISITEAKTFVEAQKDIERKKFFERLEEGITEFEETETKRLVSSAKKTPEFRQVVGFKTLEKVATPSGIPRKAFLTEEGKKFLADVAPKITGPRDPRDVPFRQKLGSAFGKAIATIGGAQFAETEEQRQAAARIGEAIVKGGTFGLLAPEFTAITPEEEILGALTKALVIQKVAVPLTEKAITKVIGAVPLLSEKLRKSKFFETVDEARIEFVPVEEKITFQVKGEELLGVRVGKERFAKGVAFAVEGEPGAPDIISEGAEIFRIRRKLSGAEFIEVGRETFEELPRVQFIGRRTFDLPTRLELRIFEETGKFPAVFEIAEKAGVETFDELTAAIAAGGEEAVEEFLGGGIIKPTKGFDVFFEQRAPLGSEAFKGTERLLELISPAKRGVAPGLEFAGLAGGPLPSEVTGEIVEEFLRISKEPVETLVTFPKLAAGAAFVPKLVTIERTGRLIAPVTEVAPRVGSLFEITQKRLVGFEERLFLTSVVQPKAGLLALLKPLDIEQVTKPAILQLAQQKVGQKLAQVPKQAVQQLERLAPAQRIDVAVTEVQRFAEVQRLAPALVQAPALQQLLGVVTAPAPAAPSISLVTKPIVPGFIISTVTRPRGLPFPVPFPRRKPKKKLRRRGQVAFPRRRAGAAVRRVRARPDIITKTITEIRTFRPARALPQTQRVRRTFARLRARGVQRFPTREVVTRQVGITPKGGLRKALLALRVKVKKRKKRRIDLI